MEMFPRSPKPPKVPAVPQPPEQGRFQIEIANNQQRPVETETLERAIQLVLEHSEFTDASISLAIVDDETIHDLNRQYLEHDYPTDVLSFPLERDFSSGQLNGEIIVSADTAFVNAEEYQWPYEHELLLYVVHGALHLVGYDDKTHEDCEKMREAETSILAQFSIKHRYDRSS